MARGGSHAPTSQPWTYTSVGDRVGQQFLIEGADVITGKANQALNIGDLVFLTSLNTFDKANTPASYATLRGIVVGGKLTDYKVIQSFDDFGNDLTGIGAIPAGATGDTILVAVWGVAWGISDVALTVGAKITGGSVTAGRVSTTSATAGQILGVCLDAAAGAGTPVRVFINCV